MAKKPKADVHEEVEENVVETEEQTSQIEEAKQKVEEYKNLYLRALADYKNLEHRINQERQKMRSSLKKEMVYSLLPVLDNLDQAEVFNQDPGLKMISASFRKSLEEMGVTEVELLGSEFNPEYAEAVEVVEGKEDNIIIDIIQKAYKLDGQVIRPGKVRVSKKS